MHLQKKTLKIWMNMSSNKFMSSYRNRLSFKYKNIGFIA